MSTYLLHGFYRQDHSKNVLMLVDSDNDAAGSFAEAKKIAGNSICFIATTVLDAAIPDDCKGVVFNSKKELYARVPQLAPPPRRRARSAARSTVTNKAKTIVTKKLSPTQQRKLEHDAEDAEAAGLTPEKFMKVRAVIEARKRKRERAV